MTRVLNYICTRASFSRNTHFGGWTFRKTKEMFQIVEHICIYFLFSFFFSGEISPFITAIHKWVTEIFELNISVAVIRGLGQRHKPISSQQKSYGRRVAGSSACFCLFFFILRTFLACYSSQGFEKLYIETCGLFPIGVL